MPSLHRTRSPTFTAAVTAVVLAVVACSESRSPEERVAAAPSATLAEGTADFSLDMNVKMGEEGSGMDMTMSGQGVADLEEGTGRMEMTYPGMGNAMTMIFHRDVVYVRVPAYLTGGEGRWIRQDAENNLGMNPGSGLGRNPLGAIRALEGVEGEIRTLGADTVAGTDVRGYGFTVIGAKLWGESEQVPRQLRDLSVPSEVWLDRQDRIRRMVMEIDLAPVMEAVREQAADSLTGEQGRALGKMLGGMQGTMTLTTNIREFGVEVDVQVPDEADVVDRDSVRPPSR